MGDSMEEVFSVVLRNRINTYNFKKIIDDEVIGIYDDIIYYKVNNKIGLVDINGNLIIEPRYANISKFSNGFALANDDRVLIDKNGKEIISSDNCNVKYYDDCNVCRCYRKIVNTEGKILTNDYSWMDYLNGGFFIVENDIYRIIHASGKEIYKSKSISYREIRLIANKYILIKNNLYDRDGNIIFTEKGCSLLDVTDDKYFLIHRKNKIIKIDGFENIEEYNLSPYSFYNYKDGIFLLKKFIKDEYKIIDTSRCEYVFNLKKIDGIVDFNDETIYIYNHITGNYRLMSIKDNEISIYCNHIDFLSDGYTKIKQGGKCSWGIYKNVTNIVPCKYDKIEIIDDVFYAKKEHEYDLYNKDGKNIYHFNRSFDVKDIKEDLIVINYCNKWNMLINKSGDIIIDKIESDIFIFNDNKILVDNHIIDLNQEYVDLKIDYQLILSGINGGIYSFETDAERTNAINRISSIFNSTINEDESAKRYIKK